MADEIDAFLDAPESAPGEPGVLLRAAREFKAGISAQPEKSGGDETDSLLDAPDKDDEEADAFLSAAGEPGKDNIDLFLDSPDSLGEAFRQAAKTAFSPFKKTFESFQKEPFSLKASAKRALSCEIDISGEISQLRALFAEQREIARKGIMSQLGDFQGRTASDLAGRGIYRSPLSEWSFGRNRKAAQSAIGDAFGKISATEAQTIADLLSQLSSQKNKQQADSELKKQRGRNELLGLLSGSITSSVAGWQGAKQDAAKGARQDRFMDIMARQQGAMALSTSYTSPSNPYDTSKAFDPYPKSFE